ncbi:hypothetical protein [Saccharicrinis aurantiacus]|uniref:hypothetical protein n=1 Tax=Saccharicrinis aurantiacus TaxID=1849719 RepID=UPI0009502B5B|nr:hypothetical protein [Saccharicrinis aurantiacus]
MRITYLLLLTLILFGCTDNRYLKIEVAAIQDISNDYIKIKHRRKWLKPPPPSTDNDEIQIDFETSEDQDEYKVFLSDALIPISQVKEDNQWMFDKLYETPKFDSIFNSITNSERFGKLGYKEYEKKNVTFNEPYQQFVDRKKEVGQYEEYLILGFSRVCFNEDYTYGLVVIDYKYGWPNGTGGGFHRPYLIKIENDKWKVIEE